MVLYLLQSTTRFTPLKQLLCHVDRRWHVIFGILLHFDESNNNRDGHLAEHDLVVVRRVEIHLQEVAETLAQVVVACSCRIKVENDQRFQDLFYGVEK